MISLIKNILALGELVKFFVGLWESYKIKKAEKAAKQVHDAKVILSKKIDEEAKKEAPDEEAIKELHRRITRITSKL